MSDNFFRKYADLITEAEGQLPSAANDSWDKEVRFREINSKVLTAQTYHNAKTAYQRLGRVWENSNNELDWDVYVSGDGNTASLYFHGQIYDAFTARSGVEDDDEPDINDDFQQYADRIKAVLTPIFPTAEISISTSEKYSVDAQVELPHSEVINANYNPERD